MNIVKFFGEMSLDGIDDLLAQGQEENLWLDFKVPKSSSLNSIDDKKNLTRALSGFANSSGGIVIWGIDARKNDKGIDCANELKPIDNVQEFLSRLNSLTGDGVDPTVANVQHRTISTEEARGYAITFIPESETGPHMAKLGEDRYYKRSGDSFYKMEHYDISDMFGKRQQPKLDIHYMVLNPGPRASVKIGLLNEGRATACGPFLSFGCNRPFARDRFGLDGNGNEGLPFRQSQDPALPWTYGGSMDLAIHPKMLRDVTKLSLGTPSRGVPEKDLVVNYAIACENQPLNEGTLVIPINELQ